MQESNMSIKGIMTHEMVLSMVAHLVLFPNLYRSFKDYIKLEHFKAVDTELVYAEIPLLYIWKGLLLYYSSQEANTAPSRALLEHYVRQALSNDLNTDAGLAESLFGTDPENDYIEYIYSTSRSELNATTGRELLQQFLVERSVTFDFLQTAQNLIKEPELVNLELAQVLSNLSETAQRISTIGVEVQPVPAVPDEDYYAVEDSVEVVPSGIPFIDAGLGGGQRRGSVNGIIGCTGAGKTTLGLQLLISNSMENRVEVSRGLPQELCLFYSFEQSASDILPTMQSNAMNIAISSLRPRRLSTCEADRKEYEKELWPDVSSWVPESQRWLEHKDWLNSSVIIQNFSGVPDITDKTPEQLLLKRNRGKGGISEIQNDVEELTTFYNKNVRVIIIDYAGLVRYRQYGVNTEDSTFYNALALMGDDCRKQLAGRFNCSVWLLHQIAGASNGMSPLKPMHHSNAAGCKSFADNLDTCLCLGNPDNGAAATDQGPARGKSLYATFSKTRSVGGRGFDAANRIVQHNLHIRRLDDVTDFYRPDPVRKEFIPASEYGFF